MADDDALIEAMYRRGLSKKTIAVYTAVIRRASCELDLDTVGAAALSSWAEKFTTRPMRALVRSALRAYFLSTGRFDGPWMAISVPRRRRMRCRALEEPQAALLASLAYARALQGTRKGLAVLFGLYAGLRRSEIADVRWSSISEDGWITVVGKGAERSFPLHPRLQEALVAARSGPAPPVRARRPREADRLFIGVRGRELNPTTVWGWVRELGTEAGLVRLQTHVLRHTALTTALEATGDLRAVQELAGHARPETTAGYTRASAARLTRAVASLEYGTP